MRQYLYFSQGDTGQFFFNSCPMYVSNFIFKLRLVSHSALVGIRINTLPTPDHTGVRKFMGYMQIIMDSSSLNLENDTNSTRKTAGGILRHIVSIAIHRSLIFVYAEKPLHWVHSVTLYFEYLLGLFW